MKLYGMTLAELEKVVRYVSADSYDGNLRLSLNSMQKKTHVQFTLRVADSRGPGAHRSWSGRRTTSACWHAHFDVMQQVFVMRPAARLVTAMARYDGIEDFLAKYRETASRNVGSMMQPASYGDLCECERAISDQPSREVVARLRAARHHR